MSLDIDNMKRNENAIESILIKRGTTITTKEKIFIIYPSKYLDKNLCLIKEDIELLGFFAIVDDKGNYCVTKVPTRLSLASADKVTISVDGLDYDVLEYRAGDVLINNTKTVVTEQYLYDTIDLFHVYGKVPFFFNETDLNRMFNKAGRFTGGHFTNTQIGMELLNSIMTKSAEDKTVEARLSNSKKVQFTALNNVFYSITNNLARQDGAYMKKGMIAAINQKEIDERTKIEEIVMA